MPPQVLAAAVVLQSLHGLSGFETVLELRCDLRWNAACGLDLLHTAFAPSLLTYFRRRLQRSTAPDRLFSKDKEVVAATGVLRGKHRRALDSTVSEDAVATLGTVTQLKVSSAGIFACQRVAPLHRQQTKNLLAGCWPRRAASPKRHLGRTPALPRGPTKVVRASRTPPRFADTG
ncbi:transposase [Streptomyces lydicus]|uniref:transposase n=1 Tax=Streptomyces lydicus TaxID=47763 RepID=UPI0037B8345E